MEIQNLQNTPENFSIYAILPENIVDICYTA